MKVPGFKSLLYLLCLCYAGFANGQLRIPPTHYFGNGLPVSEKKVHSPAQIQTLSGYYFQGFESTNFPPEGWQSIDEGDTLTGWRTSLLADVPAAYEGTKSAHCVYSFNSDEAGVDWLISPKFQVNTGDSLYFRFKLEYRGFIPDSTFILVSTTDSATGSFTHQIAFYASGFNYPADTINWYEKKFSLQAFVGQSVWIGFLNRNSFGNGIFIDNVEIGHRPNAEVGVVSIDLDGFTASGLVFPKMTVKNYGSIPQTFPATLKIGGGYMQTQNITLLPQEKRTEIFPVWNATTGDYPIHFEINLAGDTKPENDTMSSSTRVLEGFQNYGWTTHEPLSVPTFGACVASVTPVSNPRFFLFGGYAELTIVKKVYQFDLGFDTWSASTDMPKEATFAAVASGNGKVFVLGGRVLTGTQGRTQIFNPETETWTNGASMPTAVVNAAFATYKDSLVYIIGGYVDATQQGTRLTQIYNMYTNTWTTGTPKPGKALFASRAGCIGNKIVVAGGVEVADGYIVDSTFVGEIDPQNPSQIIWTQVQSHPAGGLARCGTVVSLNPNSSLVVFAAGSNRPEIVHRTNKTFAFDFATNTWKLGPDKPTAVNLFQMAPVVKNDSVYLVALGGNVTISGGTESWPGNANEWLNMGPYQAPTGVQNRMENEPFSIYPNPSSGCLHIKLAGALQNLPTEIRLVNALGKRVMQQWYSPTTSEKSILMQTGTIPAGLYKIQLTSEAGTFTQTFIRQ